MHALRWLLFSGLVLLVVGCFPEERVWWARDGERALVSLEGRLHLVDAQGRMGAPLEMADGGNEMPVKMVAWLREGGGFVALRVRSAATWAEARSLIPEDEVCQVEALLPLVLPVLEAAVRLGAEAMTLDELMTLLPEVQMTRLAYATRRVHELEPERVKGLLRALPKGAELAASLEQVGAGYEISELCVCMLLGSEVAEVQVLARSLLRTIMAPSVSPRHDAVAFLTPGESGDSAVLEVLSLAEGTRRAVAQKVSAAFDWTPDGRGLVFMAPLGGEGEKLQTILRLEVLDAAGTLVEPGRPITYATGIPPSRPLVRVLADGRVLFASQPVTLPSAGTGPELAPRLYLIPPEGGAVTLVPTAPGDLPVNLGFFTASPDGRRVAVVESETDAVAVVEVDTGVTRLISPPHARWHCRTMPAWKSATELTYAALHEGVPAWMLWSGDIKPGRCLSASWPVGSTARWLERQTKPKTTDETATDSQ